MSDLQATSSNRMLAAAARLRAAAVCRSGPSPVTPSTRPPAVTGLGPDLQTAVLERRARVVDVHVVSVERVGDLYAVTLRVGPGITAAHQDRDQRRTGLRRRGAR